MTDRGTNPSVFHRGQRLADVLDRHTIVLGLLVVGVMVFLSYISIVSISGIPFSHPYRLRAVLPANSPVVAGGDEVDVAGQRVGSVKAVVSTPQGAVAEMAITRGRVGRNATATVRLRGLAGSTYIALTRGDSARPAPVNYLIPASQTAANTELSDVIASFGRQARSAMGRDLYSYGAGLAGHGQDLSAALADLPVLERQGTPILSAFTPRPGLFAGFISKTHSTVAGLGGRQPGALSGLIGDGAVTSAALAAQRAQLTATIGRLRPFSDTADSVLPLADPVLTGATVAVRRLTPGIRALSVALPGLRRLLGRTRALAALPVLAHAADPVLAKLAPVLGRLYDATASLTPLADALGPLAAYLAPYKQELYLGPHGFTTWGGFSYNDGQARGAKAVRFAMILTCQKARDPYPAPGQVLDDKRACR